MISRKLCLFIGLSFVGATSVPPLLPAAQVTLTSSADTCIFEASPFNNAGGHVNMAAGATAVGSVTRALLKFDVAATLPGGATVTSARLNVTVVRTPSVPADSMFAVHRILADWGEGNKLGSSGGAATADEATWVARKSPTIFWSSPGLDAGTDYAATPSSTVFVQGLGGYEFSSSPEMVADVQTWLTTPASNFGWLLLSLDEMTDSTARRFGAREDFVNAPQLIVNYTTPVIPPHIDSASVAGNDFCLQFQARAGKSYVVQRRERADSGDWTVVTTLPPAAADGPVTVCDPLTGGNQFYRVGEQ